jgi:transposase-like protein
MTDGEAETVFRAVRWTDGKAICPHCECPTVYECRSPSGALRFRCKACRKDFSITSGTLGRYWSGEDDEALRAVVEAVKLAQAVALADSASDDLASVHETSAKVCD